MRPGCTPVDRRPNVICHNAACSMKDACTCICKIACEVCRDRQSGGQKSEIGGQR